MKPLVDFIEIKDRKDVFAAYVYGELRELTDPAGPDDHIQWLTFDNADAVQVYKRGLLYILYMALKTLKPKADMKVFHSLSKGIYIEFEGISLDHKKVVKLEKIMRDIVKQAIPFERVVLPVEEAIATFEEKGLGFKKDLIIDRGSPRAVLYRCGDFVHYFYGYMPPDTSYINLFELVFYQPGIIALHPSVHSQGKIPAFEEQPKIHRVHLESENWGDLMGVATFADLNRVNGEMRQKELIHVMEALHEKKIAQIADEIYQLKKRVILIAGPSSSGKTTFAQRLMIQLRVLNLRPVSISVDNYFVHRHETPLDKEGNKDYESIDAINLDLLNRHLRDMLEGKAVELPRFDFHTGTRHDDTGDWIQIDQDQPIIIEGIHGLNDILTKDIFRKDKYKIYVSCLTYINMDPHYPFSTTDNRLLRRMIRDMTHRGHSPIDTLRMWGMVRRGEENHIFSHQEKADAVFNSALIYEMSVIKKYAEPLLKDISGEEDVYPNAKRLLTLLSYIQPIEDDQYIPSTSILREFIGGSSVE